MKKTTAKKLHLSKIKVAALTKAPKTNARFTGYEACYSGIIACTVRYCQEQ
jgi:hypothetical protein